MRYIDTKIDKLTFFRVTVYYDFEIVIKLWNFKNTLEHSITLDDPYEYESEKIIQNLIENNTDKIRDYSLSLLSDLLNVPYFGLKEEFKCFKREC